MPATDEAEILRLYLTGRDVPCPRCGYNLRDGVAGVCPECGAGIKLHVHPVIKLPLAHGVGVFGLSTGAVLGVVTAILGFSYGPIPLVGGGLAAAYSIIGLFVWDKTFFRVRRRGREAVLYLVLGAWAGTALAAAIVARIIIRNF